MRVASPGAICSDIRDRDRQPIAAVKQAFMVTWISSQDCRTRRCLGLQRRLGSQWLPLEEGPSLR